MTREEAIERLSIHKSTDVWIDSIAEAVDMAIEALSAETRDRGEWMPCSERLPEEEEMVLTYDSIGHIDFGQYDRGLWYWLAESCADYWMRNDGVIAWMPLPAPYKGGDDK